MPKKGRLAIHGGSRAVPDNLKLMKWPDIREEDKIAVTSVLERGIIHGAHSPEITGLERDWSEYVGCKYALAFNSGTAAIHGGLFALGLEPGDEVITTAYSFSGTYQPILYQGAFPVFIDIDPSTFNLNTNQIESKITEQTRAIIPVHIHGLPADMDEIMSIADKHNLMVLEDACQAHGARYKEKHVGTIGQVGAFSLNATKNLSGGEGGLLVTDNEKIYHKAKSMRQYGEIVTDAPEYIRSYACDTVGYNYRTHEMPAAFVRSQLKRLDEYTEIAQRNAAYLNQELGKIKGLLPPNIPPDRTHVYNKYRLRFDPDKLNLELPPDNFRDKLLLSLRAEGVQASLWHTEIMPAFPIFQTKDLSKSNLRYRKKDYPEAVYMLETSLIVNTELHHICIQNLETQEVYVEAFRKIFDNLDELINFPEIHF
ncbi:MAG: DegT/DnrJ/EryC1/StrS family aminotransferase [Nitrospinaceae bacterium]|jgi:dTDP-4-amino-4,6-dideoxygalactose transaminase|nr:DegT/DnrJ/EryC1/StrS family aminotransferase [Nitrospinaceae bacterium]|tara:strand:+ start:7412 stop:8689 length:1278 start_codon:yes stop_codon:yes gene_type:complete